MLCIAKIVSCRTVSSAAVQLRKLVAGGETPDMSVCSAAGRFILCGCETRLRDFGRTVRLPLPAGKPEQETPP